MTELITIALVGKTEAGSAEVQPAGDSQLKATNCRRDGSLISAIPFYDSQRQFRALLCPKKPPCRRQGSLPSASLKTGLTVKWICPIRAEPVHMKERLRLLFQCIDRDRANTELTAWIREADSSGIRILKDAAKKLLIWKPFILNWHKHRISTGKLEAINCKIGTLQRNAYGYRDEEYLKLRIYNLYNSTCALTG